jgi:vitamin B12 transporter
MVHGSRVPAGRARSFGRRQSSITEGNSAAAPSGRQRGGGGRFSNPPSGSQSFFRIWLLLLALALLPARLAAQRPGEVAGRVVEAGSAAPLEMAAVEIVELGVRGWTDGTGRFRFRGVESGAYRVRITRAGYGPGDLRVDVRNGETAWLEVSLAPAAVALETVRVTADADPLAEGTQLTQIEIEASGARTAADVVERVPGVVVRSTSAGGARTVSIRGSAPDQVLVLVDGAPLNDPVSGEADLSAVSARSIDRVVVLPGARSARYGPRAAAGVILIETRAGEVRRTAELSAGTLDERAAGGEWGVRAGSAILQAGGAARTMDGVFDHARDPNDPTIVRRTNADLEEWNAFGSAASPLLGGELRARGGWEAIDRGLPGTGHTPSPFARQEMERGRASLAWRRASRGGSASALLSGAAQRVRYADSLPPFGLAYDDTTRARVVSLRVEADRIPEGGRLRGWGGGVEATTQRVDAGALSQSAPRTRTDVGAFGHASGGIGRFTLSAEARADRDGLTDDLYVSRALTAGTTLGIVRIQLANRSSYSPPSLGDQFFRSGVGVQPNPDLRPERVPNEWELGASASTTVGAAEVSAYATAYTGDVRGMIVWLPDFRFRWSPRNVNAVRRGVDTRAEVALPSAGVRVRGSYALARITYADESARGIQLAYRPRHTGSVGVEWRRGPWRVDAAARYTGERYPVAARVNALAGFWSTEARAGRDWRLGAWTMTTAVDVDRALDEKDSLIAGFPEPGRRVRLDVRVARTDSPRTQR